MHSWFNKVNYAFRIPSWAMLHVERNYPGILRQLASPYGFPESPLTHEKKIQKNPKISSPYTHSCAHIALMKAESFSHTLLFLLSPHTCLESMAYVMWKDNNAIGEFMVMFWLLNYDRTVLDLLIMRTKAMDPSLPTKPFSMMTRLNRNHPVWY